ncbi:MAG: UPF0175 family protein [Candidatus Bathyarchaeia archaeon]
MTEATIAARVPKEVHELIEQISVEEGVDKSTVIRRLLDLGLAEWRLENALRKYQRGEVTLLKASEVAGISIYEMVTIIREREIPYRYDLSDLEEYVRKRYG